MKQGKQAMKYISMLLVVFMLAAALAGCTGPGAQSTPAATSESQSQPAQPAEENSAATANAASDEAYLQHYFEVAFSGEVSAGQFAAALQKVTEEEISVPEESFGFLQAAAATVTAANFEELAATYTAEKAAERLASYGVEGVAEEIAAPIACALDTGLLTAKEAKQAAEGGALQAQQAASLVMRAAKANGNARNSLGKTSDADIYDKLNNQWNSFYMFDDPALTELGKTSVEQSVTTGYNLKHNAYNAKFLPELTMQYGHSEIKHAHQLVGLLNSEGIVAQVQLEPKVSVYQYLLEWGPVPEPSPGYEVREFDNDLYLVFAMEYDMLLEFENQEDMLRFDSIIEEYAKKYEGNEDALGLLYSSWWQPLYSTTKEGMPAETYHQIYDCVVTNGEYTIHPFCLPEDYENVVQEFEKIAPTMQVEPVVRYCNTAFYNYMTGEDFQ